MLKIQTQDLELTRFYSAEDSSREAHADWPVYRDRGAASTAVVYFELEPGKHLGTHTDSAEEVLVVLDGEVEVIVGGERGRVRAGGIAVVPAMVPHDVICTGGGKARVAGVFSANTILSAFEGVWEPVGSNVVGTPPPEPAPVG